MNSLPITITCCPPIIWVSTNPSFAVIKPPPNSSGLCCPCLCQAAHYCTSPSRSSWALWPTLPSAHAPLHTIHPQAINHSSIVSHDDVSFHSLVSFTPL